MLGAAAILLGISIIAGIVYTYVDRSITPNDLSSRFHLLDIPQLPADL